MNIDWKPIQTAPIDGTVVLLAGRAVSIGRYDPDKYSKKPRPYWARYSIFGVTAERGDTPTHWAPLPELPPR